MISVSGNLPVILALTWMSRVSGVTPPPSLPSQVTLLQRQTLQVGALESGGLSLGSLGLEEPGTMTLCADGTFPGCRGGSWVRRGHTRPDAQREDIRVPRVRRTATARLVHVL